MSMKCIYFSQKNVRVSILHIFGKTLFGTFVAWTVGRAMFTVAASPFSQLVLQKPCYLAPVESLLFLNGLKKYSLWKVYKHKL